MATKKTKRSPAKKKPAKKAVPPKDVWTEERVRALYKMDANTAKDGHEHEWEWEKEPYMPPICLGCNATGDKVERNERYGYDPDERRSDEDLMDDGFGDDILDDRYF